MATIPGGRKGKAPTYGSPSKPSSRVARRAELQVGHRSSGVYSCTACAPLILITHTYGMNALQGVEVQYDLLPGVKLAWANTGTYTSGPSSSPKKYTSTLVGKTSPHYSSSRAAASGSPGQVSELAVTNRCCESFNAVVRFSLSHPALLGPLAADWWPCWQPPSP